ncbi:MAG TPA: ADP/ATP-dependent (S)-NAD(P)H-hydrate dehydratase [Homoserinimonas sp.]|nr:ADP/ATP-dependent (S)-NAD(P)H-hydrate dehydratase [Homoserinimonas sp.]
MTGYSQWTHAESAAMIAVPSTDADKYSRGVLGVVTGSARYPGAAVLGVEAAIRTGVGMVRYLGTASELVLQRRPEAVTVGGRVQAWLLGSGIDSADRDPATTERMLAALSEGLPTVIDSGALDLIQQATGPTVITPHFRELAGVLSADAHDIAADPDLWCARAVETLGVTVLLKGTRTRVAGPDGTRLVTGPATGWLASAGTGDVLGGVLGALLATHSDAVLDDRALLPRLAASAAVIHAAAADLASSGGPLAALDLAGALPETVAHLLRAHPRG